MALEEGKDFRKVYFCNKCESDNSAISFATQKLEELEFHFLQYHPTSQQIANIFGYLATMGLSIEKAIEILGEAEQFKQTAQNYLNNYNKVQKEKALLEGALQLKTQQLAKGIMEERERCFQIVKSFGSIWDLGSQAYEMQGKILNKIMNGEGPETNE